jgi:hypothetical protein
MKEYCMKKTFLLFIICMLAVALLASGSAGPQKISKVAAKAAVVKAPDVPGTPAGLPTGWSTPENISNSAVYSQTPYVAVDAKSKVYVSWEDWYSGLGDRRDMMFNTNKSGNWGAPHSNSLVYTLIDDVGFPEVAVTPSGNNALYAWMDGDFSLGRMVVRGEELANGTWSGSGIISTQVSQPSTYPTVAASPVDNTICFVWQQDMGNGFQIAYQYRDGTTGQMSSPNLVASTQTTQYLPNIMVDTKGTAHCAYTTRIGVAIVWYTSNSNPKNLSGWTAPLALSGASGLDWTFPKIATDNDGNAYVVWQEEHNSNEEIYLKYQISGAWQDTINLSNTAAPSEFPVVSVNPATHEIFVAWLELTGGGLGNIYLKTYELSKTTGKMTWSDNIQVTSSGRSQKSGIRVSNNGDVHLVYADNGEIWHTQRLAPPPLTGIQPPTVASKISRVLFASQKTLTIDFAKNPVNDDATLKEYRLYYKRAEDADNAYTVLATFAPAATFEYVMTKLKVSQKYNFIASVVNKDGLEIQTASVISD